MKTLKNSIIVITLFAVQVAVAKPPPPLPPPPPAPATFDVNPVSLRQRLLESNLTINQTLDLVKDAKDQVNYNRGLLLPSINLSAMLTAGVHSFIFSGIQFLLPFFIPSNWFNYKAQKDSFEAEKLAYLIMELNIYASALSLYYTVKSDAEVSALYQKNANVLNEIVKLTGGTVISGTVLPTDILQTKVQADTAGTQALQLKQLVDDEIASLRQLLGFPLSTTITLSNTDLAPTAWETMDIQAAVDIANKIAPEHKQIDFLVSAAQNKAYSAKWGWITGPTTLSSQSSGPGNASFSNMSASTSMGFGFTLGPTISLANRNVIEVQKTEIQLEQTNTTTLETAILSFKDLKGQLDLSLDGESKATDIYNFTVQQFKYGAGRFVDLLTAYTQIVTSSVNRIRAQQGVNLQRVVLDRMSLSDEFANIKGCSMTNAPSGTTNASLDQLCRQKSN